MNSSVLWNRMRKNPFFVVGSIAAFIVILFTVIGPMFCQFDPIRNSLVDRFKAPDWFSKGFDGHIMGTDQLGRDVFTRLLVGARYSLMIAFSVIIIRVFIGTTLGVIAGYFGGIVETLIMRTCDVFAAIPNLVLAIAVVAILGPSITNLIIVLVITGWIGSCRVTRNNVRLFKNQDFVRASVALGAKGPHIMFRQIFPNVTNYIIIIASQGIGQTIIVEAALSFLNLGIQQPTPSWGNMISAGRNYMTTCPWMVFAPGIALMVTAVAFNFLGDGLRDILDPKRTVV